MLEKGAKLADAAFAANQSVPPEKRAQLAATIRNRAAAFDRLKLQNDRLKAKLADMEKELEAYNKSAPAGGEGAPAEPPKPKDWQDELDEITK